MEKRIKTVAPVVLPIAVLSVDPTFCDEDCPQFWVCPEPKKNTMKAMCIFGRLRWANCKEIMDDAPKRHKSCLAAKEVGD